MKTNIFIPETIKVGFQNREGTYTKKLAYVVYYDQKGVLRKEASWNSWRDNKIEVLTLSNEPISGLVLNKKVGGHSNGWNHRQTYVRVYDPRDFEFEISVPNLLYILENTNSIKGKGLEGEFIYGWDGTELILIPTSSPDYIEISQFNKILHEKSYIKSKELILGATYKTKNNDEWIYLGRFDYYGYYGKNEGKKYFFYNGSKVYSYFEIVKSLGDKIISVISEDCVENYAELFEKLESKTEYSPYDESKDEYVRYDYDAFLNKIDASNGWGVTFYTESRNTITVRKNRDISDIYNVTVRDKMDRWNRDITLYEGTLESIYENYIPMYKNTYLTNGKLYQKGV